METSHTSGGFSKFMAGVDVLCAQRALATIDTSSAPMEDRVQAIQRREIEVELPVAEPGAPAEVVVLKARQRDVLEF